MVHATTLTSHSAFALAERRGRESAAPGHPG
jgi:hypothetical protein